MIVETFITHRGPFTQPRRCVGGEQRSVIVSAESGLPDRISYLANTKGALESCRSLPQLYNKIFDLGFKNFTFVGKSLVFAGFWGSGRYAAITIPDRALPLPQNASIFVRTSSPSSFPIQKELIEQAIETKDLAQSDESGDEHFLAVPIVDEDRSNVLGVLLFSNRLSNGTKKFTKDDIRIARALSEVASEELARWSPAPSTPPNN